MRTTNNILLIIAMILLAIASYYMLESSIVFLGILFAISSIGILILLIINAYSWRKLNPPKHSKNNSQALVNNNYSKHLR